LPMGDHQLVGLLGPFRGEGLGLAADLVVVSGPWASVVATSRGGAGGELELALLVRDQAGTGEGIVLLLDGQVPGQDGQLPGGGDDGLLEAASSLDAVIEGPKRARSAAGRPGRLDQHPAGVGAAGLTDPAVHGHAVAGLTNPRVQPQVGDQLVGVVEAGEVPDRGNDADPGDRIHTRNRHQPSHDRITQGVDGQLPINQGQLAAHEVQLTQ
jgi:hypothetical protein